MKITLILATLVALAHALLAQNPPSVVNYQGRVTRANGQPLPDGTVKVEVNIYDSPLGGTLKWDSGEKTVNVRGGVFALALQGNGATTPALGASTFATGFTWFEVVVWDGNTRRILSPRQLIAGVPWSLWASTVSDGSIGSQQLASDVLSLTKVSGGSLFIDGSNLGINFPLPSHALSMRDFSDAPQSRYLRITDFSASGVNRTTLQILRVEDLGFSISSNSSPLYFGASQTGVPDTRDVTIRNGNVGIGNVSPEEKLDVEGNVRIGNSSALNIGPLGAGNKAVSLRADGLKFLGTGYNGVSWRNTIGQNVAEITCPGDTNVIDFGSDLGLKCTLIAGDYVRGSSMRFKRDVRNLESTVAKTMALRPVKYRLQPGGDDSLKFGLIAEEVAKVFPDLVTYEGDGKTALGLDYMSLVPVLIKSIQELKSENDSLKSENRSVRKRLIDLESKFQWIEDQLARMRTEERQ